jgi:serine O-acetyltransferase
MWELFKQDARRWVVPGEVAPPDAITPFQLVKMLWRHMPLRAMLWFRFGSWCKQRGVPGMPGLTQRLIYRLHGLEIGIGMPVAGGLYIAHPIGTVVFVDRIGENVSIIAAATLGLRNEHAFPSIGNDVFIGAGARILGGISVGDGAVVGANAVVIEDVPAGATVVGVPARIVKTAELRALPLDEAR